MPLMMRRAAFRTGLASVGTLASVLLVRKLWQAPPDGSAWSGPAEAGSPVATPSPTPSLLRDVATALVSVTPRAVLPSFAVATVAADGRVSTGSIAGALGRGGTVLNLWATWCGPCRREMRSLARLADETRADRIAVLPVSVDRNGPEAVRAFFREDAVAGLPTLVAAAGAAEQALSLGAIPVTFVIDRHGRVAGRLDGGADWGTAEAVAAVRRLV